MTNRRGGKPGPRSPSASADATPETTQDRGGRDVFSQIVFPTRGPAVFDPVTYTAMLPVAEETVQFVSGLLATERRRRGTRGPAAGAGLLPAGGAGAALVTRCHPAGPAGRGQPDRILDRLPASARGHRRPR